MNTRTILILSSALVLSLVAGAVISFARSSEATARAEAAASEEATARANQKAASAEAAAKESEARAAEATAKAEDARRATAEADRARASLEAKAAEESRRAQEAEAEVAREKAREAEARRETAKREAEAARDAKVKASLEAEADAAKAAEAEHRLAAEKLKSDKVIAEAKLLELKKIDFDSIQEALLAWQQELDERARALEPDRTAADLTWVGGTDDTVVDASGNVVKKPKKEVYDPEADVSLPPGDRALARANRLTRASLSNEVSATRARVVGSLEALYKRALEERRVIDAAFYKTTLKSLYPDWEMKNE